MRKDRTQVLFHFTHQQITVSWGRERGRVDITETWSRHPLTQILPLGHFSVARCLSQFPVPVTFFHDGTLPTRQVKLQGGVSGWRRQVQSFSFISTNETDSDGETLAWAPNHGLNCPSNHCERMEGQEMRRQEARAGLEWG